MTRLKNYPEGNYSCQALALLEPDISRMVAQFHIRGLTADDLAQELRFQLWRKIEKYHPEKAGIRTWGVRVMRNYITDLHQRTIKKNVDVLDLHLEFLVPLYELEQPDLDFAT